MTSAITVEKSGNVAEIVIDRPPVNAVDTGTYESLTTVFRELSARTDVHVVLLRAEGRAFSAGADLKQPAESESIAETGAERRQRLARTCYEAMLACSLPTIAAVHGAALGAGAVLAACCDIRLAATNARIGLPEITAGRCGGGAHMMRLMPQGQVRQMYFTGTPMTAQEAHRLGFVQQLCEPDQLLPDARALATEIAEHSPLGLRLAKQALNEAERHHVNAAYAAEQSYTLRLGQHPDAAEAAAAIIEKRRPTWSWPAVQEA